MPTAKSGFRVDRKSSSQSPIVPSSLTPVRLPDLLVFWCDLVNHAGEQPRIAFVDVVASLLLTLHGYGIFVPSFLFGWRLMPETKKHTFEEIARSWKKSQT